MKIRFIGDVHGKFGPYKRIMRQAEKDGIPTIQVGDMGVGFIHTQGWAADTPDRNPPFDQMVVGHHRFIRGNHDNPSVCRKHKQCIADGTIENDVMFIGGALSIDREFRVPGYSWWPEEELSPTELARLIDIYAVVKPRVMVTHDCPENVALKIVQRFLIRGATRAAFQVMLDIHRPKLWIFGHWHFDMAQEIDGTQFICLGELSTRDIDLNDERLQLETRPA